MEMRLFSIICVILCAVVFSSEASSHDDVCSLPKVVGPCRARIPRWHFDSKSGRCLEFFYGGCRGNANNFKTEGECMRGCVCSLPHKTGFCRARFPKMAYDVQTGTCKNFIWGGCFLGGNGNVFSLALECYQTCAGVLPKLSPKFDKIFRH